jgi:hypothetical protein
LISKMILGAERPRREASEARRIQGTVIYADFGGGVRD